MPRHQPPSLDFAVLLPDLKPIPQDDGVRPLAQIAYSDSYTEAMSYLRALMAVNELSQRTLTVTDYIIAVNPAHYTCWGFRLKALFHVARTQQPVPVVSVEAGVEEEASELVGEGRKEAEEEEEEEGSKNDNQVEKDAETEKATAVEGQKTDIQWLTREIGYLDKIAVQHEKNYQIWHHRQLVMDRIGEVLGSVGEGRKVGIEENQKLRDMVRSEQAFTGRMFDLDSKNYHVWSYRQWMVRRFGLFADPAELASVETLLGRDVRNNSAWNHRFFLVFGSTVKASDEVIKREVGYTQSAIYIAPQNLSPWNYLRGIFSRTGTPLSSLIPFCLTFAPIAPLPGSDAEPAEAEISVENVTSSHALDLLAEIYANEAKSLAEQGSGCEGEQDKKDESKRNAVKALELLAERYDPIRAGYWDWRKREVLAV